MRIFESINKGFESKYGDLDSKKEKKVAECGKVGVQKESCNKKVKECTDTRSRGKKAINKSSKLEESSRIVYKDMGQDLAEYQKWVDYDMKRYHKISDKTMDKIKEAGLTVVKDQYGDYEVIAHEPVREAVKNVDPRMSEYMKKLVDVYSNDLDYENIVDFNLSDSTVDEFFDLFIDGQTEKRHPKIDEFASRIVEQGYDDRHMWKESITDKLSNIGNTHNYITPMAFGFEYFINGGEDLLVDIIGNKNFRKLVQIVSDKLYYETFRALRGYYRTVVIELIKYANKESTDGKSGLAAIKDGSITYKTAQFDEDVEYIKELLNPKHIASFFKYAGISTKDNKDLIGSLLSYLGINPKTIRESNNNGKKTIKESLKLIMDIGDYRPWSGAVDTFDKIRDADMVDALENYLEDIYPEGLTVTELNDILWFDGDTVLRDLGLSDEEEDEDEDEEDIDESCKKSVKEGRSVDFKKLHRCKK